MLPEKILEIADKVDERIISPQEGFVQVVSLAQETLERRRRYLKDRLAELEGK